MPLRPFALVHGFRPRRQMGYDGAAECLQAPFSSASHARQPRSMPKQQAWRAERRVAVGFGVGRE